MAKQKQKAQVQKARVREFDVYTYRLALPKHSTYKSMREHVDAFLSGLARLGLKLELCDLSSTSRMTVDSKGRVTVGSAAALTVRTADKRSVSVPIDDQGGRAYLDLVSLGFVRADDSADFAYKTAPTVPSTNDDELIPPVAYVSNPCRDTRCLVSCSTAVVRVDTKDPFQGIQDYRSLRAIISSGASLSTSAALARHLCPIGPKDSGVKVAAYHIWPVSAYVDTFLQATAHASLWLPKRCVRVLNPFFYQPNPSDPLVPPRFAYQIEGTNFKLFPCDRGRVGYLGRSAYDRLILVPAGRICLPYCAV